MEPFKERKFECRYCFKRFACGKSLGGHIRTHMMNENSLDSDEDEHNKLKFDENGGQSSYGLRENPKKNKRFVDQREIMAAMKLKQQQQQQQQQQLLCCRECGKSFASSKALCGHMASHSEREKIVMDSQSDTEASSSPIRRRSKRAVKHHSHKAASVLGGGSSSIMMNHSDSESFEASRTEPAVEETAWSLIMMSRDSSHKKGHNLVGNSLAESSDNYSVILETKSSSVEQLKIFNAKKELCKDEQLRSVVDNGDIHYDSDNSDSGYFENGPKKLESDVYVDVTRFKNKDVMRSGSGFNSSITRQDKNMNWFEEEGSGSRQGRCSTKYDLRKSKREFTCYSRKKIKNELTESVYDSGEQSLETDSCAETNRSIRIHRKSPMVNKKANGSKKKSKGHECPICYRVFKSGQALGGHKRSHFIGNQEHRTLVIQHQVAREMHALIDLNLPAPIE